MPKNFGVHAHTHWTYANRKVWYTLYSNMGAKKTLAIKYHGNCLGIGTVIDDCKQYFSVLHMDFIEWAQNVERLRYIKMRCMLMRMPASQQ